MSVVISNVTRDHILATMCRNIWLETVKNDINLKLVHIPGNENGCADLLSRWHLVNNNQEKLVTFIPHPRWRGATAEHLC